MTEHIKELGKVFIDKDGAIRLYISKKIQDIAKYKDKQRLKIIYYPDKRKMEIEEFEL